MNRIVRKRYLNPEVIEVEAPLIARKRKAGQFVVLRAKETGEGLPASTAAEHAATCLQAMG